MHVLLGSRPYVFFKEKFLVANQARNIFPFFPIAAVEDGGAQYMKQSFPSCADSAFTHPPVPRGSASTFESHLLLLLDLHGRFPWPLIGLFCCSFLWRLTTPLLYRFSSTFTPQQLFLQAEIIVDVHTILLLLLLLCLHPAATVCLHC